LIKGCLDSLHRSHQGLTKSLEHARQLFYWPTLANDVTLRVKSCKVCQEMLPSKHGPIMAEVALGDLDSAPLEDVGTDIFHYNKENYLVLVDRASGFLWCDKLVRTNTASVIRLLSGWFCLFGYPSTIRSDGGPQYRQEFDDFCAANSIHHELSSAYNPESNGLAEAAVYNAKYLLQKSSKSNEDFQHALLHFRNTPRQDGYSPAQLLFGRRQQTELPTLNLHHRQIDQGKAAESKVRLANLKVGQQNRSRSVASHFSPSEVVYLQDTKTKQWTVRGRIASQRPSKTSYIVILDNGSETIRNQRFIRPAPPSSPDLSQAITVQSSTCQPSTASQTSAGPYPRSGRVRSLTPGRSSPPSPS